MNTFRRRKYAIMILVILTGMIFVIRLFSLQVLDPTYRITAESNSRRLEILYPARGLIYERNGELLVYNEAAYDLLVDPSRMGEFDTLDLLAVLNISKERLISGIEAARAYSRYKPYVILRQISSETYAILQEKLYKFPGFFVQSRTLRKYTRPMAAHVLGYVGEVNEEMIARDEYYQAGDYIGISGIERAYEQELRGEKGRKIYLVDVHNRIQGPYQDGRYDIQATLGENITITIDGDLQAYGEKLMKKFRGSIVALEPSTGEILAMVTSPAYEPSLLVGRMRTENYQRLQSDSLNPLFNRALMAQYPPGSTWKPVTGLIGLQEGVITPYTQYDCKGGFHWPWSGLSSIPATDISMMYSGGSLQTGNSAVPRKPSKTGGSMYYPLAWEKRSSPTSVMSCPD
jgi:penicillin-binding protein 2